MAAKRLGTLTSVALLSVGVAWLLSIPFAPFFGWLLTSAVDVTRTNWPWLLGADRQRAAAPSLRPPWNRSARARDPHARHGVSRDGPDWQTVTIERIEGVHYTTRLGTYVDANGVFLELADGRELVRSRTVPVREGSAQLLVLRGLGRARRPTVGRLLESSGLALFARHVVIASQGLGKTMVAQDIVLQAILAGHSVLTTAAHDVCHRRRYRPEREAQTEEVAPHPSENEPPSNSPRANHVQPNSLREHRSATAFPPVARRARLFEKTTDFRNTSAPAPPRDASAPRRSQFVP